jgi:hypothetical protein
LKREAAQGGNRVFRRSKTFSDSASREPRFPAKQDGFRKAREVLINEDFCFPARKAGSGRSEVYQDIHELRTGRA